MPYPSYRPYTLGSSRVAGAPPPTVFYAGYYKRRARWWHAASLFLLWFVR